MWEYRQSTGKLTNDSEAGSVCYSGHGSGVNNPAMQDAAMVGPIPVGSYTIGAPSTHPKLGPLAMALTPNPGTDTFGRSGFFMHGDNSALNHSASEGCIIASHNQRLIVAAAVAAGDDQLAVTE